MVELVDAPQVDAGRHGALHQARARRHHPAGDDQRQLRLFWASVPNGDRSTSSTSRRCTPTLARHLLQPHGLGLAAEVACPTAQRAAAMMDATIAEAKTQFEAVRATSIRWACRHADRHRRDRLDGGGPAGGPTLNLPRAPGEPEDVLRPPCRPGPPRAARRAGPKAIFYFQAFDEPWKQGDDGWGLFNARPPGALRGAGPRHLRRDLGLRARQLHRGRRGVWVRAPLAGARRSRLSRYTLFADVAVLAGERAPAGLRCGPVRADRLPLTAPTAAAADGDGPNSFDDHAQPGGLRLGPVPGTPAPARSRTCQQLRGQAR